jgi:hypothetical protein
VSLSFGDSTDLRRSHPGLEPSETGLQSFDNDFFENPEPSTFGLLGTALAAIGYPSGSVNRAYYSPAGTVVLRAFDRTKLIHLTVRQYLTYWFRDDRI